MEWLIFNPGFFAATPELALVDWFIGVGLSIFTYMLPIVIAIMITQRS
jgi:hypothetical protein